MPLLTMTVKETPMKKLLIVALIAAFAGFAWLSL